MYVCVNIYVCVRISIYAYVCVFEFLRVCTCNFVSTFSFECFGVQICLRNKAKQQLSCGAILKTRQMSKSWPLYARSTLCSLHKCQVCCAKEPYLCTRDLFLQKRPKNSTPLSLLLYTRSRIIKVRFVAQKSPIFVGLVCKRDL